MTSPWADRLLASLADEAPETVCSTCGTTTPGSSFCSWPCFLSLTNYQAEQERAAGASARERGQS